MAKIRSIKPEFFRSVFLYELEIKTQMPIRVAFAGLWTAADREGRFRWSPRELKLDCLPYDDVDFSLLMDILVTNSLLIRYEFNSKQYGFIPTWHVHQRVRSDEAKSALPDPNNSVIIKINEINELHSSRDEPVTSPSRNHVVERKGKEGKGIEEKELTKVNYKKKEIKIIEPFELTEDLLEWGRMQPSKWTEQEMLGHFDYFQNYSGNRTRPAYKNVKSAFKNSVMKNWSGQRTWAVTGFKSTAQVRDDRSQAAVDRHLKNIGENNYDGSEERETGEVAETDIFFFPKRVG